MPGITEIFVDYLFDKASEITDAVINKALLCRADYFSVAIAGASKNRTKWQKNLKKLPNGNAQLLGYSQVTDSKTAALINGFNAHSLELDDGQRFAMIHLGASIISAINAAKTDYSIEDNNYLDGIIMGYEAACRISIAMQPSHKQHGYHAAGTCGTIGSAVGVAFALGLNKTQMKRAITCAVASSAGMLEIQEQKSELKPYNVGRAAMDGLTAAYMGIADFEPPDDIIGGERGFFKIFADKADYEKLIEGNKYFEIERIYVKPYASCRHSHSAVEAAIYLHDKINIEQVESIIVETYKLGVKGHNHTKIQGVASAKLSTPYSVAAALLYGKADLSVFEPIDERIVSLANKVQVVEKEELTKESPQKRIAIVKVKNKDGFYISHRVDYAKGDPENPMTKDEMIEKASALIGLSDAKRLYSWGENQN